MVVVLVVAFVVAGAVSGSSHPPLEGHENVKLTLSEPS